MSEIKKTMVGALAFVTEHGNMSEENLELFTNKYCVKSTRSTGTGEPRETVRLYDVDGNTIGRRCSVLKVWLTPADFNGDIEKIGVCREANKLKTKHAREADAIVKAAEELRIAANELEEPMEKLEAYEAYDAKLEEAKTVRNQEITVDDMPEDFVSYETINDLAEALDVDVITTKASA